MSAVLRPPSIGPIVGHTTDKSARIWIRGAEAGEQRTVGLGALFIKGKYEGGSARYFRLHRPFDRTGTTDFTELRSSTKYAARFASITIDDSEIYSVVGDDAVYEKLPAPEVWVDDLQKLPAELCEAQWLTFPAGKPRAVSFVFGSCRYPGILWQKKRADQIFAAISRKFRQPAKGETAPQFFLMVGDQIYADTLNRAVTMAKADTEEEFRERYLSAFGAPNTRELLRSVPTYMILDDHEIEDNWVQGRLESGESRELFRLAISAYQSYQWSHGPRNFGKRLYYSFECGGFPFFVLDGRTQRLRDDDDKNLADNHLLGYPSLDPASYPGQIDLVCNWLIQQQKETGNRPKFVVSASVFVPNTRESTDQNKTWRDDSWAAFPETRRQLLKTITGHEVQNVVFLSGDIHCSNVAAMTFHDSKSKKAAKLKAFSVTSSAFYWPFPFADGDPNSFVWDSDKQNDNFDIHNGMEMRYKAWNLQQDDNFTQLDVTESQLVVRTFDKNGNLLGTETLSLA